MGARRRGAARSTPPRLARSPAGLVHAEGRTGFSFARLTSFPFMRSRPCTCSKARAGVSRPGIAMCPIHLCRRRQQQAKAVYPNGQVRAESGSEVPNRMNPPAIPLPCIREDLFCAKVGKLTAPRANAMFNETLHFSAFAPMDGRSSSVPAGFSSSAHPGPFLSARALPEGLDAAGSGGGIRGVRHGGDGGERRQGHYWRSTTPQPASSAFPAHFRWTTSYASSRARSITRRSSARSASPRLSAFSACCSAIHLPTLSPRRPAPAATPC